jgi:hypothetical protein
MFDTEFNKYEKEYISSLSESDIIKEILKKDKKLTQDDINEKLYGIPKPNNIQNPINEYIFQEEHIDNTSKIQTG